MPRYESAPNACPGTPSKLPLAGGPVGPYGTLAEVCFVRGSILPARTEI
jgi:hypothetical protein